jgi:RHS repeat-associated protein
MIIGKLTSNLKFDYNHTGKRIAKHVYNQDNTLLRSEYYTRDASDNVMAVYRLEVDQQNQEVSYRLRERHIYGSSMLGIDRLELELIDPIAPNNTLNHIVGMKSYTGSNHLGNVLTTFSDKKIPVENNGTIEYYNADVTSSTDYYPFGVTMKGRDFNSSTSRFGFNSMACPPFWREKIEETETMDFGARLLDGDLGVWLALDPFYMEFTSWSPYSYAYNNPISFIDKKGEKPYVSVVWSEDKTKATITITNYLYVYETGKGSPEPLCATDIVEHLPGNTFFLENVEVELNINVEVVNVKNKREAKQRIRENGDYGVIVNNSTRRGDSYHQPKGRYDYIKLHPGYTLISQVAAHELGHDLGFSDKYILVGKLPYSIFPFTKMLMSTGENKLSEFEQLTIIFDVLYNNSLELNNGRPVRTDLEIIPKGEEIITTSPEGHKYKTIIKDNYGTHEGEFNEED